MSESIILKKSPKIEFQLHDDGFEVIDGQTEGNTGFYAYHDLQSIDLNSLWFPRFVKWFRAITWILNGVPLIAEVESWKKAKLMIHSKKTRLGIWLTDFYMADNAKKIKELLDEKAKPSQEG